MGINRKLIGDKAEKKAERYLTQQGLSLLVRNYRHRLGEIDLIMKESQYLVFIEVRSLKSSRFCHAKETVDDVKQKKLINAANAYLQHHRLEGSVDCRFDVVAIHGDDVEWIKNAF